MTRPVLVLITGMPCTGKTTLASALAQRLSLPCVGKDGIKEVLFETLGYSESSRSTALGAASFELLYYFIEAQLKAGRSLIAEGNFHAGIAGHRLNALNERYDFKVLQILCRTEPDGLLERYRARLASGERHRGHQDGDRLAEFSALAQRGEWEPVPVESELIIVHTDDFGAGDYDVLAGRIKDLLSSVE